MSSPLPSKLPASARKFRDVSAGLFMGVSEFVDTRLSTVPYAVDDAVDLAHLFVVELELLDAAKAGLLLAGEPRKDKSKTRLETLLGLGVKRASARMPEVYREVQGLGLQTGRDGLFVLSFAGHGVTDRGSGVLLLEDAVRWKLERTGLHWEDLLVEMNERVKAERKLLFLDACRELYTDDKRGAGEVESRFGEAFVQAMEAAKGCAVLSGAGLGGLAYDDTTRGNGVFTAALLDGLSGEAPGNADALVTVVELAQFAEERVNAWIRAHKQVEPKGISTRFDSLAIKSLPLAINSGAMLKLYKQRSGKALAHLVQLTDAWDALFLEVQRVLRVEVPQPEHFELIDEVEAFDGSPRLKRALRAFLEENKELWPAPAAVAPIPPTPPIVVPPPAPVVLRAEPAIEDPFWAAAKGRDEIGQWADLRLDSVVQRLRFIPPGEFWMGSPETEESSSPWEGPRHRVKLTQGFWLASTPCTQEFWQLVMGTNPSRFQSPRRPVEQVSWHDVQEFLKKLEALVPGIGADLPTEAQWEHACRAGTETSTYAGEMKILGARNAPLLDGIAWYGGNSGVGYELSEGHDSSWWKEKQYPHVKAGTREVGQKLPNPWGLYDMLGNVWEWCRDAGERATPYPSAAEVMDPFSAEGSYRVFRGGSWSRDAMFVRAARRSWYGPGLRRDDLGLRFFLGRPRSGQAGRGAR